MGATIYNLPVTKVIADANAQKMLLRAALLQTLPASPIMPVSLLPHLAEYFLLYWEGKYFKERMKEGKICGESGPYIVGYNKCTPELAFHATQLHLSFRKPKTEFNLPGYVVVSLAINGRS